MLKASDIAVSQPASPKSPSLSLSEQRNLCFLWEIATNAPGNDQGFIPQKHLQPCVKEMSPFIPEENALYKSPFLSLSLRRQNLRTSLRIHVKTKPAPLHTAARQLTKSMYLEILLPGFASYLYNLLTLQPGQIT